MQCQFVTQGCQVDMNQRFASGGHQKKELGLSDNQVFEQHFAVEQRRESPKSCFSSEVWSAA